MKKGLLLISLLLLTLCANLRAQETDSWVVFDSNGEVVDNVEIPADEEDDFLDEELSVPGELGEDDEEYDGNIWLTNFGNVLNDGQNITGRAVGFEKAAVLLEMSYGEEDYTICSGAMVGPNLVLTAAHCLLNPYGNFPTKVVAAGMEEKNSAEVIDHWIPDQFIKYFKESSNKEMIDSEREGLYDYAFLKLDKNLGKQTGYFGVKSAIPYITYTGSPIYTIGWACTEPKHTLWKSSGRITLDDKDFFVHNAYAHEGTSGAPVVLQNHPSQIIGITTLQWGIPSETIALYITPEIVKKVVEYRKKWALPQQQTPKKKKQKTHSI